MVPPYRARKACTASSPRSCLERYKIDPALIEIELTELSMIEEEHNVIESLQAIQAIGIKLLVDDFGTGYS